MTPLWWWVGSAGPLHLAQPCTHMTLGSMRGVCRGLSGPSNLPVPSTMRLSALLSAARPRLPPGYRHGMWPPDSMAARLRNPPGQRRRKVFVEPIARDDWKVFKGDTVRLLLPSLPPGWQLGWGSHLCPSLHRRCRCWLGRMQGSRERSPRWCKLVTGWRWKD
ncbi:hypothetical protein Nmel_018753 [Mimus melanotis]